MRRPSTRRSVARRGTPLAQSFHPLVAPFTIALEAEATGEGERGVLRIGLTDAVQRQGQVPVLETLIPRDSPEFGKGAFKRGALFC